MKILALDLGTHTGVAHTCAGPSVIPATWNLASAKEIKSWGKMRLTRRCDPRIYRFFCLLKQFSGNNTPDLIVHEDVLFSSSTFQVQMWASLRAAIWTAFGDYESIQFDCVPTGTLKKFATGSGSAKKEDMAAALFRLSPELKSGNLDDNSIDAIWIHRWAVKTYAAV